MEDRLRLLTPGFRTAPPRHRTMHATQEWSYQLLSDLERSVLCRLSVFTASFTLCTAATVAAETGHSKSEIIDSVLELVAKSLVSADVQGAEPRLGRARDDARLRPDKTRRERRTQNFLLPASAIMSATSCNRFHASRKPKVGYWRAP